MAKHQTIWRDDWETTRQAWDPRFWKRHGKGRHFSMFGQYTERSMRKWMELRGHSYDLVLRNGQRITVKPRG